MRKQLPGKQHSEESDSYAAEGRENVITYGSNPGQQLPDDADSSQGGKLLGKGYHAADETGHPCSLHSLNFRFV
ncbi:hypothetical protein D3C76_1666180 [compost metagenome]